MPLAGQRILAGDFAGSAFASDATDEANFNTITYTLGATIVGVVFQAPTSGTVLLIYGARLSLNSATAARVMLTAEVRAGSSIGSGTVVAAANDAWAIEIGPTASMRLGAGQSQPVSGLTPGTSYNVSLWHRNVTAVASAASIFDRNISVIPMP